MSNVKFDADNQYFSGQGVMMLGVLAAATKALLGYEPVGNVSDLKLSITTSVVEHKGSQDGQRAIDKRIQTSTNAKLSATLESWSPKNLGRALRGDYAKVAAATGVALSMSLLPGLVGALGKIKVSTVVVSQGATPLVEYTTPTAAWDFKVNADAGSLMLNNGSSGVLPSAMGLTPTSITVGATTSFALVNSYAIGDEVLIWGLTGVDAAFLNGKTFVATTGTNGTTLVIAAVTTGKTITTAAGSRVLSMNYPVDITGTFAHDAQYAVQALTQPLSEVPVRFEGLNTATDNSPVVVDVWKFSTDPLKELALISDTFGQFVLEGSVLSDSSQPAGTSKYFRVTKLNV